MVPGMLIRSLRGTQGQITVPSLGAVVAELQSWNLQRREESGSGNPIWTLHAVFRYQNDLLLKNDALEKLIVLRLNKETKIELCSWESLSIEGVQLIAEGVVQCQTL